MLFFLSELFCFMLHWCCFVYPDCLFLCFTGVVLPLQIFSYSSLVLFCLSRLSFSCFTDVVFPIRTILFYASLVLFCLSGLSFFMLHWCSIAFPDFLLYFTGGVLFITIVFFMFHWCCFSYPDCFVLGCTDVVFLSRL
jgi:hypothetical protein